MNPPPRSPARSTSSSTTIACRSSGPDRLVDVRPQERVPRRIVEQTVDTVPVVQLLHVPVPQMVDSVVEVLKILDKSFPDVEQVIEVPKILQHTVLQRSSLQEPQLAEQLVDVPTPSPAHVPVPRMEDQLVEVPQIETHTVPAVVLRGYGGAHLVPAPWACGSTGGGVAPPHPVDTPTGIHRPR